MSLVRRFNHHEMFECIMVSGRYKQASKHTHVRNAVTLVQYSHNYAYK